MCAYLAISVQAESVRTATWFISHAWSCEFMKVVDSIFDFFEKDQPGNDFTIWFDVFSNSQHDTNSKPSDWWTGTFMNAVATLENVLMIMIPWEDPIPLKRAWCVFEFYACVFTKSRFEIGMPSSERERFFSDLQLDATKYLYMLSQVKSEKSEAREKFDKDAIHDVIRKEVGFTNMDSMMFTVFQKWMIDAFEDQIRSMTEPVTRHEEEALIRWKFSLAQLFRAHGDLDESERLFVVCLESSKRIFGEDHQNTLATNNNLSEIYIQKGRFDLAEPLALDCLKRTERTVGADHHSTLASLNGLALVCESQGKYNLAESVQVPEKYDLAEPLYYECLERTKLKLGLIHPSKISLANNLAFLYKSQNKYDLAEPLFLDCLEKRTKILGKNHPSTLASIYNLAGLYEAQEK
ncbi:Kinesin light chain 3 [Nowakowskiella sp. JEL0407]|nr:Kinesin light chain 3 [Nowakowskiella sp. JEL0407]